MSLIDAVEIHTFQFEVSNLSRSNPRATGSINVAFEKDATLLVERFAVVIKTDDGLVGSYVTHWGGTQATLGQTLMIAPVLVGRNALEREGIFDDLKRELRQYDGMGHGPLDIALWDLAGHRGGCSVSELLGGYRKRLPAYASTYHGDRAGGLDSKEAFADFADHCFELGYRAFKVHGWDEADVHEEEENVGYLRQRVGDRMVLMLDPASRLRTFADALFVGRACDDAEFFWYEDPFRDASTSAFAHKRLRELIKTPLLLTEHVRGLEPKADFLIAGGTDMLRADPEYDMGITGVMKIAHLAEAFGVDCELHATGPAHRACMSAMRNSNYYEVALVGPDTPNMVPPVYADGYSDQLDCVDEDGTVPVPNGPGLGVSYDWDFIQAHRTGIHVFK